MIVLGAFIAGARDLSFDSYGYGVVFLSNISTAIYLATISRLGKSSGLNSFGLMWCNGIMCTPLLFFWTLIRGDLEITMNFQYLLSPGFMLVILLSCILAFFLNYSIFLNTTLNSAVTQTICGNLKDFFTIALGWIFFGGLPFDILNVIGQLLGFLGSGLYAYFKLIGKWWIRILKFIIVPVEGESVAPFKVFPCYRIWYLGNLRDVPILKSGIWGWEVLHLNLFFWPTIQAVEHTAGRVN